MREKKTVKTSLFLLELILALLFFALCAAVCMRMFAGARSNINQNRELSGAMSVVQSAAAAYKHSGGDMEKTAALLGGVETKDGAEVYYTSDWEKSDKPSDGGFVIKILPDGQGQGYSLCIVAAYGPDGQEIFSIPAASGRDNE